MGANLRESMAKRFDKRLSMEGLEIGPYYIIWSNFQMRLGDNCFRLRESLYVKIGDFYGIQHARPSEGQDRP